MAVLVCACTGCHTLRNQLSALKGSSTTATDPTSNPPKASKVLGVYKPSKGILDQTFRFRHDPSELNPGRGAYTPKFDWDQHHGQLGGAFGENSSRHQGGPSGP